MRKLILFLFVLMLALTSFVACDGENTDEDANTSGFEQNYFFDVQGFGPNEDSAGIIPKAWDMPSNSDSPYADITEKQKTKKDSDGVAQSRTTYEYNEDKVLVTVTKETDWNEGNLSFDTENVIFDGEYDEDTKTVTATVDAKEMGYPDELTAEIEFTYDYMGRVKDVVEYDADGEKRTTHHVAYNDYELPSEYTRDNGTFKFTTTYEYQDNNTKPESKVKDRESLDDGTTASAQEIEYEFDGTQITEATANNSAANSNSTGTNKEDIDNMTYKYSYDDAGNVSQVVKHLPDDESAVQSDFQYDWANSLVWIETKIITQDDGTDETTEYEYNYEDAKLEKIDEKDAEGNEYEITFSY